MEGQTPLATVIGCSDSRVPPELVFDVACGDLFVIRTAGHVLGSWTLASLEYALVYLRTPLVAVLAHSRCGAVTAAVRGVDGGEHLPDLVARIAHAIPTEPVDDPVHATTLEHLRREVTYLRHEDPVVAPRHASGEVMVVGLHKDLVTRRVNVVVGPQDPARPLSV